MTEKTRKLCYFLRYRHFGIDECVDTVKYLAILTSHRAYLDYLIRN